MIEPGQVHAFLSIYKCFGYVSHSVEGENTLDIFAGTCTTMIACKQTNRTFYGCELDPRYCDVAVKRWEKYTGNQATRIPPIPFLWHYMTNNRSGSSTTTTT